jgi:hypothetical protein
MFGVQEHCWCIDEDSKVATHLIPRGINNIHPKLYKPGMQSCTAVGAGEHYTLELPGVC